MQLLLAHDVSTNGEGNPYVLQLTHALERHRKIQSVQHGTSWLFLSDVNFDLIHVQWPESLFSFSEPSLSELRELKRALDRWKSQDTALVATVHNEHPHGQDTDRFQELYRLIYDRADGLIHLGEASLRIVRRRYAEEVANTKEVVIPHGNYEFFPNQISQEQARERLNLPHNSPILLAFGALRSRKETRLLRKGFSDSYRGEEMLVVAARLPHRPLRDWRHIPTRLLFWLHPQIQLHESYIPSEEVQIYLNAADVLVLARIDALNSGNVTLGWTFGTVVVGPETGVIGEMLNQTDSPTYEEPTPKALGRAIQEGIGEAKSGKGERLLGYARKCLNWKKIAEQHTSMYYSVSS